MNITMANDLLFAEEDCTCVLPQPVICSNGDTSWKVLIVDDDLEIHSVTKLILGTMKFDEKPLHFISAYTSDEAMEIMSEQNDIAVLLLDVVMETEDAGLQLVRKVRNELSNHSVRIVLRTGQPGHAPERKVILNYDINDYKSKTELTSQKLLTTVVAAWRTYKEIVEREQMEHALASARENLEGEVKRRTRYLKDINKELKRQIKERKKTEERMRQSEKMEVLGQLAGGVAHDFNNQLSIISGFCELLREKLNEPPQVSHLDIIKESCERSSEFTQQLLALSRKGKCQSSTVTLHHVIADMNQRLHHTNSQ